MKTLWLLACFAMTAIGAPSPPSADVIVAQLQKQWDKTKSFESSFTQVVTSPQLGTTDTSTGTIQVLKPDRLRWTSDTEHTVQILNGHTFTIVQHNPRRKTTEVDIIEKMDKSIDTRLLKFLAGTARFSAIYRYQLTSQDKKGAVLRLTPRKGSAENIEVEISKPDFLIKAVTTESEDSKVRIVLSDLKTNPTLKPEIFHYVPKPTDIVRKK